MFKWKRGMGSILKIKITISAESLLFGQLSFRGIDVLPNITVFYILYHYWPTKKCESKKMKSYKRKENTEKFFNSRTKSCGQTNIGLSRTELFTVQPMDTLSSSFHPPMCSSKAIEHNRCIVFILKPV